MVWPVIAPPEEAEPLPPRVPDVVVDCPAVPEDPLVWSSAATGINAMAAAAIRSLRMGVSFMKWSAKNIYVFAIVPEIHDTVGVQLRLVRETRLSISCATGRVGGEQWMPSVRCKRRPQNEYPGRASTARHTTRPVGSSWFGGRRVLPDRKSGKRRPGTAQAGRKPRMGCERAGAVG